MHGCKNLSLLATFSSILTLCAAVPTGVQTSSLTSAAQSKYTRRNDDAVAMVVWPEANQCDGPVANSFLNDATYFHGCMGFDAPFMGFKVSTQAHAYCNVRLHYEHNCQSSFKEVEVENQCVQSPGLPFQAIEIWCHEG